MEFFHDNSMYFVVEPWNPVTREKLLAALVTITLKDVNDNILYGPQNLFNAGGGVYTINIPPIDLTGLKGGFLLTHVSENLLEMNTTDVLIFTQRRAFCPC